LGYCNAASFLTVILVALEPDNRVVAWLAFYRLISNGHEKARPWWPGKMLRQAQHDKGKYLLRMTR
jgi:hypothetical protein